MAGVVISMSALLVALAASAQSAFASPPQPPPLPRQPCCSPAPVDPNSVWCQAPGFSGSPDLECWPISEVPERVKQHLRAVWTLWNPDGSLLELDSCPDGRGNYKSFGIGHGAFYFTPEDGAPAFENWWDDDPDAVASDGQRLSLQSADTIASFRAMYGAMAESAWATLHEQAIR